MAGEIFVVLGAGMQGTAAAYDLLRAGAGEVRIADRDGTLAAASAARLRSLSSGQVRPMQADAADPATLEPVLRGASVLLSAVPYLLNPGVARACVDAGVGYCDLGGNTEVSGQVLGLHERAVARGLTLVPDCGLAPGLANTLLAAALQRVPQARHARMYCGGLPQDPEPPFGYHLVFAMEGLLNEYAGEAQVIRHGQQQRVRALDEVETLDFPELGRLEAFATSGGTSTTPRTFQGRLDTLEYKTLRYSGHVAMMRAYRDAGLLDEEPVELADGTRVRPRELLSTLLRPRLHKAGGRDLVALRVEVQGDSGGGAFSLVDRYDQETGFSAMERCTAFPAAVVACMIAAGETEVGAVPLETGVPPEPFLDHLAQRDLPLRWEPIQP